MKLTKSQIKKIIQEEIEDLINEIVPAVATVKPDLESILGAEPSGGDPKKMLQGFADKMRQKLQSKKTPTKVKPSPLGKNRERPRLVPKSKLEESILDALKTLIFPASRLTGNIKDVPPKEKLPIVHEPVPGSRKGGFRGGSADPRQPIGPRQSFKAYMEDILGRLGLGRRKPVEQWTETNPETGELRIHMDPHEKRSRYVTDPPGVTRPRRKTKTFKGSR